LKNALNSQKTRGKGLKREVKLRRDKI